MFKIRAALICRSTDPRRQNLLKKLIMDHADPQLSNLEIANGWQTVGPRSKDLSDVYQVTIGNLQSEKMLFLLLIADLQVKFSNKVTTVKCVYLPSTDVSVDKCSVLKIGCGTAVDADFLLGGNVLPTVTPNCYSLLRSRSQNSIWFIVYSVYFWNCI